MKYRFVITLLLAVLLNQLLHAQTRTLNGVYAGVRLSLPVIMGNGMERSDEVYYFRPNGTFNDDVSKPDWQTAVSGKYTISGNKIHLVYTKGKPDDYTINSKGNIDAGSYTMLKMGNINSVPPGFYKFNKMSTFGGGNSGMAAVHTAKNTGLYFDGKGNFARNQTNSSAIIGDNIGGGGSRKSNDAGTYTIKNGVLTLTYGDGHSEQHSFFSRPEEQPIMAAIDGDLYFMGEDDDKKDGKRATKGTRNSATASTNQAAKEPNSASLIQKAHEVQGGNALDAINTLTADITFANLTATTKLDIAKGKARIELRRGGKLQSVEQVEGSKGWTWQNGKQSTMAAARISEMRQVFKGSVLALSTRNMAELQSAKTQVRDGNTVYVFNRDGVNCLYLINPNGQLIGEGYQRGRTSQISTYSDFRKVQGILLPFKEQQTNAGAKYNITYTNYSINPQFTTADWDVPAN